MDYYQILGIHPDASAHEIKKAYRRLVKTYHPDLQPDDPEGAQRIMHLVNEAYAVLSKPAKRREHDRQRAKGAQTERTDDVEVTVGWESEATEFMRQLERQFQNVGGNRFESKDAAVGVTFCFIGLTYTFTAPEALRPGMQLAMTGILVALLIRAASRLVYQLLGGKSSNSTYAQLAFNAIAAFAVAQLFRYGQPIMEGVQPFPFSIGPPLTVVIIPSIVGAALGRAISTALNPFAGMAGGALIGGVLGAVLAAWPVGTMYVNNFGAINPPKPSQLFAVITCASAMAGAVGALKSHDAFFSAIEFFEDLLDWMMSPQPARSKALARRKQ